MAYGWPWSKYANVKDDLVQMRFTLWFQIGSVILGSLKQLQNNAG